LLRRGNEGGELHGKTVVVVGQSGSANPVARRASAFGMRARLVDDKLAEKPDYAFSLDRVAKLPELLPTADVVIVCCPLTEATRGLFGAKQLGSMKQTAILIDVGRPEVVDLAALAVAVDAKKIAAAGLDLPAPTPASHPLRGVKNVTLTEQAINSPEARERRWRLLRENVRRFAAGEPLLCVIER
jgi:phosphoglycerate dehydrogenase-like enzyme